MLDKLKKIFTNDNELKITGSWSIQGRKPSQEDAFFISEERYGKRLVFVADGVGGHGHGDFASQTTVEIFQNTFIQNESFFNIPDFLRKTTLVAAAMVFQKGITEPEFKNCGTTISGFLADKDKFHTVNVGDSRVYLYSRDTLKQMTKDHSKIQEMIDRGEITDKEAAIHPERHIMTSAIGQSLSLLKIDVEGPYPIEHGDIIFAFSDGVHDALSDNEMITLIRKHKNNNELAKILVEAAYNAGGKDNITACYFRVQ